MKLYWLVSVAYCAEKFTPPKDRSKGEVCFGLAAGIAEQMEKTRKVRFKFSRYFNDLPHLFSFKSIGYIYDRFCFCRSIRANVFI